jgi:phosphohistidine phosphatase SixA
MFKVQYYPELEVVELVQDGLIFFWDHLLPTAHINSFLHYLAVSYKEENENVVSHRVSMQTLTSAGGHFEFSNGANSNNTC